MGSRQRLVTVGVAVMSQPKVPPEESIDVLVATPKACSATEADRVQPPGLAVPAHNAFTLLPTRLEPAPEALWQEVRPLIDPAAGWPVVDETTLDKPHAQHMGAGRPHWSGRHNRFVAGINLITLAWADGDRAYPTDYRLYAKAHDGFTKDDYFRAMLAEAARRGFRPRAVLSEGWYAGVENLKAARDSEWTFLAGMPANSKSAVGRRRPCGRREGRGLAGACSPCTVPGATFAPRQSCRSSSALFRPGVRRQPALLPQFMFRYRGRPGSGRGPALGRG
jgi:hypothetical protein